MAQMPRAAAQFEQENPKQIPMNDTVLSIRQARQADLPPLLDLYQHLAPGDQRASPELASEIFSRFLTYPGSAIFIGEIASSIVSSCTLVVVPNLTRGGSPYGLIENVVTDERFRGQGHATQLLDAATSSAWDHGCYKVMLLTGSKDSATINFYLHAGFEQTKTGFQKRRIATRKE
ncbi:Ribosomal protein S18 acetylase RimI [Consotaella salsifontis]|uniref:Ribosomal protein S18 acetylase RimI n=2 Tax=Consotaella salsifontis TaxID=1365950 RepID=A0A1T4SQN3_9HYPH|nr:Ribosomal protein S18 acetylase RimI [Consotaella salsifontis]